MPILRTKAARAALAAALLGAGAAALWPATAQDRPESILPPGFDEPVTTPTPSANPTPAPGPRPAATDGTTLPVPGDAPTPGPIPSATATPDPNGMLTGAYVRYEMPDYARRSLAVVGATGPVDGGFTAAALGQYDGRYLEALMRNLDAPVASRWLAITLRRLLLSPLRTPASVNGADFAAERAWLLLRMGESVAARAVVQNVDSDKYTPKLYQMAMQTALATADPGALCAIADGGAKTANERAWPLARAMCAGLAGQPSIATPIINAARKSGLASGVDLLLAQKIAGSGARGRQAVTIEWDGVDRLTAWRYGLATAGGVTIPEALLATAAPQVRSWRAQAPMLDAAARADSAEQAAVRGVFSNAALVDLYGAIDDAGDDSLAASGVARDLRSAYVAPTAAERIAALKLLWDEPKTTDGKFARLILTARAAVRVPVGAEGADIDRLVAAMLSAGLDRSALRWNGTAAKGSDAWAMLALADPDATAVYSAGDVSRYSGSNDPDGLKRKLLFAGLAGLGRMSAGDVLSGARSLDIPIGVENGWTRAIDRATRLKQPGMVVLLAATGMQTGDWHGVPPEALFRIVGALRAVGLEGPARMIAAEAIARL